MVFGSTKQEKYEQTYAENSKVWDLMIPHRYFAVWPKELSNGKHVMLQHVWRYAEFREDGSCYIFNYCLTQEEAWTETRKRNSVSLYCYRKFDEEIQKRLSNSNVT